MARFASTRDLTYDTIRRASALELDDHESVH